MAVKEWTMGLPLVFHLTCHEYFVRPGHSAIQEELYTNVCWHGTEALGPVEQRAKEETPVPLPLFSWMVLMP